MLSDENINDENELNDDQNDDQHENENVDNTDDAEEAEAIVQEDVEDGDNGDEMIHSLSVGGMFKNWFLDYASYVILERAVPNVEDGLKPVQRRIMHSMKEMDDGRFNKVANVIGQTMQYHPHGDAAIGDATVNLGQKDLFIETQGNWGDVRTGDSAAAPRYIEARLTKFALEVAFNGKTTEWQMSYDGRKKEPIHLPMKFPTVLAQGVEGIAVGLSTKIMPHNFIELIKGSIDCLKERSPKVLPDFSTGGMMDASNYNLGKRGGKLRVRSHIEVADKKTLLIKDVPYGITTTSLIESILKANDAGKIKIKKVTDNTAAIVEIQIDLPAGVSPSVTIDALYAFTNCEISISPNACVIVNNKPKFSNINDILRESTQHTKDLLEWELKIRRKELLEKWHLSSLEKIFIENRIYRDIEECETWEAVIETIDKGLDPFKKNLKREVTEEDIVRLTEIKIKRISKFDAFKADEEILKLEEALEEVNYNIANLIDYSIEYFEGLLEKYGKGKERKTKISTFETISNKRVVISNKKLYINMNEGFIGTALKKDSNVEFLAECSDLDDVIIFRKDGNYQVTRVAEKTFVGKNIIHAGIWKKKDERTVYHCVYRDGKIGKTYVKRFNVSSITRDKEYNMTKGTPGSKLMYFSHNPNAESEVLNIVLDAKAKAKKISFEYDIAELAVKGRSSQGNMLSKLLVKKVSQKSRGTSTLGGRDLWLDETIGRLNIDKRGKHLGSFNTDDLILAVYDDGSYELTPFDLSNRYKCSEIVAIHKLREDTIVSAVNYDGDKKGYYVKRFQIETKTTNIRNKFIGEGWGSKLLVATTNAVPIIKYNFIKKKGGDKNSTEVNLSELIDVKGWKVLGNKFGSFYRVSAFEVIEVEEPEEELVIEENTGDVEEASIEKPNSEDSDTKNSKSDGVKVGTTIEFDVKSEEDKEDEDEDKEQLGLF
jgi:topoisomerase-4 subunit A